MAAESRLNQAVKGAPLSSGKPPPTPPLEISSPTQKYTPSDPLSSLPSSPPQIYLNLLILETSLRSQYLHLLSRRRLNTFFVLLLALWNGLFVYLLFLRPREDGTGFGGSVYYFIEGLEKVALMGGIVTVLLVWGTGQWERGIRWPRRWVGTANRGLRGFNLRVVVVRRVWWREMFSHLAFLFPIGGGGDSDWHLVSEHDSRTAGRDEESVPPTTSHSILIEEDLAPGGDHIKLLLLPKSFSPEFRENWEEYRAEYWDKENERRQHLRVKVKQHKRGKAKAEGGWKWWSGTWRLYPHHVQPKHAEKHHHHQRHSQLLSEKDILAKASRRRSLMRSDSTHSRQSSRSSTPHLDLDGVSEKPLSERPRRGSATTDRRRKAKERGEKLSSSARNSFISPLTKADEESLRPSTPDSDSSLSTLGSGTRVS